MSASKVDEQINRAVLEQVLNCIYWFGQHNTQTFMTLPIFDVIRRCSNIDHPTTICGSQIVVIESDELWSVSKRI